MVKCRNLHDNPIRMAGTSIKKANRYLEKIEKTAIEKDSKFRNIIIISDSKGKYLKSEASKSGINVQIYSYPSCRTSVGVQKAESILQKISAEDRDSSIVLFWLLTCDVTRKEQKFIYQRYDDTEALKLEIKSSLDRLVELSSKYRVKIGILEIPPIFTRIWNTIRGHKEPEQIDDKPINDQIREINNLVEETNLQLDYRSPKVFIDLVRFTKRKQVTRQTFDPRALSDGVHPGPVIAKKWLFKIIESTR